MDITESLEMDEYLKKLEAFSKALKPGDTVYDNLTRINCKVLSIEHDEYGNRAIWIDSEWLDGGRFPWEIDPPLESE
jgi:hypothetical protein